MITRPCSRRVLSTLLIAVVFLLLAAPVLAKSREKILTETLRTYAATIRWGSIEQAESFIDPEYRAEPVMAHLGGADGLDLVHKILAQAPAHLNPGGQLIVELGTGRAAFESAYPNLEVFWFDTQTSEGEVFAVSSAALTALSAPSKRRR